MLPKSEDECDDANKAIRDQYGLDSATEEEQDVEYLFCGTQNQSGHIEYCTCGRPLKLEQEKDKKPEVLERLVELDEEGVLETIERLEQIG